MSVDFLIKRKRFTTAKLAELRKNLKALNLPVELTVVVNGSYARYEASKTSDLDFNILVRDETSEEDFIGGHLKKIENCVYSIVPKPPSTGGAFAQTANLKIMITNIGGNDDTNPNITQRILLLLEGEWLHNEDGFKNARKLILWKYVRQEVKKDSLALFLLNDFIRYYRTTCVDFEFKTSVQNKGWGLRNIKLVYSRKLLFFSGLLTIAETANSENKRDELLNYLSLCPLDRIQKICGNKATKSIEFYTNFLQTISDPKKRLELDDLDQKDRKTSKTYISLKKKSYEFTEELIDILYKKYPKNNPIFRHLIL